MRRRAGFGDLMVLHAAATRHANGADDVAVFVFQRNATGEDHDAVVVGRMDAKELIAGLAVLRELFG